MMRKTLSMLCLVLGGLLPAAAAAAPALPQDSDKPVEISAAQSLEWNRKAKTYTARKDAVARQGDMQVKSDTITAHYDEVKGATEITRLVASGNVEISSPPYTAYGHLAEYDVATQKATLTGENLRMVTPDEVLTASEKIEFDAAANKLSAIGHAQARRGTDSLSSERLDAYFMRTAQGKTVLQRITADSAVTIKTARETVTGSKGVYDAASGKAVLTGNVRIYQGENWITGERAEVNLKTGISQLFAPAQNTENPEEPPRVRGVFFPKKRSDQ